LDRLGLLRKVTPIRLDVTKPKEIYVAFKRIEENGQGLYGLVNNAAIGDVWPLAELSDEDLHREFDVNFFGVHRVTRAMLPLLVKSKGRIVNISSVDGLGTEETIGAYCATKYALEAYSEVLSKELTKHKVRVSIVEPGPFRSNIAKASVSAFRRRVESLVPSIMTRKQIDEVQRGFFEWVKSFKKRPTPEKVADAVLDALFSDHPQLRYSVAPNKTEFIWPINQLMSKTMQINNGSKYSLTLKQIHSLLDTCWRRSVNA
jgi:NAD(P)-dependent dehydrogenase (short-subunit alcohol dehydrogenase family)